VQRRELGEEPPHGAPFDAIDALDTEPMAHRRELAEIASICIDRVPG
jgi:hypothetical protein